MSPSRVITSYFLALFLALNNWPIMAASAAHAQDSLPNSREQLLDYLRAVTTNLQALQSFIDRSQFDLEELLSSLDYDHENIIAFVKREIGLEVYPGTLRGPQGTLMSRGGNTLDQSILLAKLLKDAGLDARIARTSLTHQEAQLVVQEMRRAKSSTPPAFSPEKFEMATPVLQELKKLGADFGLDLGDLSAEETKASASPAYENVVQTTAALKQQLLSANISLDVPPSATLVQEAVDYFWVQYRLGAGTWDNAHPVFRNEVPFEPEFNSIFSEEIPPDLHHKFAVQVFIETTSGNKLEAKPVSVKWERPTANLTAVPLVFANLPNTLLNSNEMVPDLRAALEGASWFAPIFEGGMAPESDFFDKNGNLIDPMAAGDPAAGIFQKIGDLFGQATGEIGGDGAPTLTAQWLEFTFTSPDGTERQHRRTVLDRIGLTARRSEHLREHPGPITTGELATLMQRHTFMLSTGETPRAMAVDFAIQTFMNSRSLLEQLLGGPNGDENDARALNAESRKAPQYWNGHLGLFTLLDMSAELSDHHLIYRSAPSLVIHSEGFSGMDSFVRAIDIVQNPRRAVDVRPEIPSLDPSVLIAAGVWESIHEGVLLGPSEHRLNTMIVFEQAARSGAKVTAFAPDTPTIPLKVNENSKAAMEADLKAGYAVVAPNLDQPGGYGWWRIDPRTGETVGQIADGRGGAVATEYLQGLALGISISLLAVGLIGCTQAYDPPTLADVGSARLALACCFLANAFLFAAGFVFKLAQGMLWDAYWSQQSICQG